MSREIYLTRPCSYVPKTIVTNDHIVNLVGSEIKGKWIEKRTGIRQRFWCNDKEACSDLAIGAANRLFKEIGYDRSKLQQLILCTISGDHPSPPSAPIVQHKLQLPQVGSFDLGAACAGFVYGIHVGHSLAKSHNHDLLIVASDVRSKFLNKNDFATLSLFGDGAAAIIVTTDPTHAQFKLVEVLTMTDGSNYDAIKIHDGGSRSPIRYDYDFAMGTNCLKMKDGADLFLKALDGMYCSSLLLLEKAKLDISDIAWIVPHQANLHMINGLTTKLGIDNSKVIKSIQWYGNTSGASVGMALSYFIDEYKGQYKSKDKILLVSAGGGGLIANAIVELT